ncbi:MAG: hypothetical protein WC959_10640 [Kiritimatiellales bacterium]
MNKEIRIFGAQLGNAAAAIETMPENPTIEELTKTLKAVAPALRDALAMANCLENIQRRLN